MEFKEKMDSFLKGMGQFVSTIVLSIIFFCVAKFAVYNYFVDNAYPSNMEYTDWSMMFVNWFTVACAISVVLGLLWVFLAAFAQGPFVKISGWFFELLVSVIAGAVYAMLFTKRAPEETNCLTIACVMFFCVFIVTFFISSFFAEKYWKYSYNPILSLFSR
jgi:hypothetical protein